MGRHPTKSVLAHLPRIVRITDATVTLGSGQTLGDHFSAADIAAAHLVYFEPHANDAWVKFGGASAPAASDGHRVPAGELREWNMDELGDILFTGTGAATITLFKYSGT